MLISVQSGRSANWEILSLTQREPVLHLHEHEGASPAAPEPEGKKYKNLDVPQILKSCVSSPLASIFMYLLFQTAHFCCSGVNIDNGFVFNLASSVSISQCIDGLLHV